MANIVISGLRPVEKDNDKWEWYCTPCGMGREDTYVSVRADYFQHEHNQFRVICYKFVHGEKLSDYEIDWLIKELADLKGDKNIWLLLLS